MKTLCKAPAKLILSGEHAVVNECPAISMAIDLPMFCEVTSEAIDTHQVPFVEIELVDCHQKHAFPFAIWQQMAIDIESRYQLFESGAMSIRSVLKQPVDLVLTTLHHFHHHFKLQSMHWDIKIYGHGLLGKGLGSSAAVIISLLHSLFKHHHKAINTVEILSLAKAIESRQHGHSSGIDPTTIFQGGLLYYLQHKPFQPLTPHKFNAWLIDTGTPESTTGQVVNHVKSRFPAEHPIWNHFTQITEDIRNAWQDQDSFSLKESIQKNQTLLEEIGIVPDKVKHFIKELEQNPDQVAKMCGAGNHKGQNGGVLLCLSPLPPLELCNRYGYNCIAINLSQKGSHCELV
ncbi:mevalonate kinase [Hydrogenovibrio marinus]|uniref:GHMP kinase N-terminal domain-containing protein n=1 Tax=Hydrogenovibrio marinus TaxID=28885 RepID=A0A067A2Y9_HYDMR|nr:hypothetical protein [Hydrogenovibrio marinus]KDN96685.1 hypothetical protein EI16_10565 [Hydrogenovibrio marinus]BBN58921.1 mevalonate kinase [Hydrogenovibrio marinus]